MLRTRWSAVTSGRAKQMHVAACANKGGGQHECGHAVRNRSDECHGELAEALVRGFLAFGVGVGEESADREQKHGAQLEIQIGSHHQARGFAHHHRKNADKEKDEAAQKFQKWR